MEQLKAIWDVVIAKAIFVWAWMQSKSGEFMAWVDGLPEIQQFFVWSGLAFIVLLALVLLARRIKRRGWFKRILSGVEKLLNERENVVDVLKEELELKRKDLDEARTRNKTLKSELDLRNDDVSSLDARVKELEAENERLSALVPVPAHDEADAEAPGYADQIITMLQASAQNIKNARIAIRALDEPELSDMALILEAALGTPVEQLVANRIDEEFDLELVEFVKILNIAEQEKATGEAKRLFIKVLRVEEIDVISNLDAWIEAFVEVNEGSEAEATLLRIFEAASILRGADLAWCVNALEHISEESRPGEILLSRVEKCSADFERWAEVFNNAPGESKLVEISLGKLVGLVQNADQWIRVRGFVGPEDALYPALMDRFPRNWLARGDHKAEQIEFVQALDSDSPEAESIAQGAINRSFVILPVQVLEIFGEESAAGQRVLDYYAQSPRGYFFEDWQELAQNAASGSKLQRICFEGMINSVSNLEQGVVVYDAIPESFDDLYKPAREKIAGLGASLNAWSLVFGAARNGSSIESLVFAKMIESAEDLDQTLEAYHKWHEDIKGGSEIMQAAREKIAGFNVSYSKWDSVRQSANRRGALEKLAIGKMIETAHSLDQMVDAHEKCSSSFGDSDDISKSALVRIDELTLSYDQWSEVRDSADSSGNLRLKDLAAAKMGETFNAPAQGLDAYSNASRENQEKIRNRFKVISASYDSWREAHKRIRNNPGWNTVKEIMLQKMAESYQTPEQAVEVYAYAGSSTRSLVHDRLNAIAAPYTSWKNVFEDVKRRHPDWRDLRRALVQKMVAFSGSFDEWKSAFNELGSDEACLKAFDTLEANRALTVDFRVLFEFYRDEELKGELQERFLEIIHHSGGDAKAWTEILRGTEEGSKAETIAQEALGKCLRVQVDPFAGISGLGDSAAGVGKDLYKKGIEDYLDGSGAGYR